MISLSILKHAEKSKKNCKPNALKEDKQITQRGDSLLLHIKNETIIHPTALVASLLHSLL